MIFKSEWPINSNLNVFPATLQLQFTLGGSNDAHVGQNEYITYKQQTFVYKTVKLVSITGSGQLQAYKINNVSIDMGESIDISTAEFFTVFLQVYGNATALIELSK